MIERKLNGLDLSSMLNGLDLFSGIGGLTLALAPWVRPVAYCENDAYAQSVLLSRQACGDLPVAPIWDDVRTLTKMPAVDIIYGGFPCQDISCAGLGAGLEGERSGLFFEVMRLVTEINPIFVFLENVPAIRMRGGAQRVVRRSKNGLSIVSPQFSARNVPRPVTNKKRKQQVTQIEMFETPVTNKKNEATTQGIMVWEEYQDKFQKRYGQPPLRNAKANSQCVTLAKQVGSVTAVELVDYFLTRNDAYYLHACHPLGMLLVSAQKLLVEMRRGVVMTMAAARRIEAQDETERAVRDYLRQQDGYGNSEVLSLQTGVAR